MTDLPPPDQPVLPPHEPGRTRNRRAALLVVAAVVLAVGVVGTALLLRGGDDGPDVAEDEAAAAGAAERAWEDEGGEFARAMEVRILDDCAAVEIDSPGGPPNSGAAWVVVLARQDERWSMIDIRDDTMSDLDPDADNCGF